MNYSGYFLVYSRNYLLLSGVFIQLTFKKLTMKKLLLFLWLLFPVFCFSQTPTIIWEKTYGGSQNEELGTILQTSDGGFLLGGNTESHNGDIQSGNYQSKDIWIVKIDKDGEIEWEKTYGGTQTENVYQLLQTENGFIVSGDTKSDDGDIKSGYRGERDIWIFEIDSTGKLIWEKTFGGTKDDVIAALQKTQDGGYLVGSNTNSSDGDLIYTNKGNLDFWLFKIDSTGNISWQNIYGGSGRDVLYSICKANDEGFILCGHTRSTNGDIKSENNGDYDIWVLKVNNTGQIIWEKTFGGSKFEIQRAFKAVKDGYIIGGYTDSNDGDIQSGNRGRNDGWVIKIDNNGRLLLEKTFGGSGNDDIYSINEDLKGGFILGGATWSNDGDISSGNKGECDFWILNIDDSGNILWEQSFGGSFIDHTSTILTISENNYLVGGYTISNDDDIKSGNHGLQDIWLINLSTSYPSEIEMIESDFQKSIIYPNPVKDKMYFNANNIKSVQLYNLDGRLVLKKENIENNILTVEGLESGVYMIEIELDSEIVYKKILKIN